MQILQALEITNPAQKERWIYPGGFPILIPPGLADRGLLSMLLLNLVHLRPGQAIFLPAGELHA